MNNTNLKILKEAERVFAQKGFLKTSVHEIAKASKLGVASLYHYYPNKEEILFAILEENLKKQLEDLNEHLSGITNPISKLEKYIWFQFYYSQKFPDHSKLVLFELRHRQGIEGISAYRYMKEIVNQLVPILREGQKQSLFEKEIDSLTFRNIVWGTLDAFTRNWLIFKRPESIVEFAPVVINRIKAAICSPQLELKKGKEAKKISENLPKRGGELRSG